MIKLPWNDSLLNIAAQVIATDVLGPGRRLCIWLQGCKRHCPGCLSPEWRPLVKVNLVRPDVLAQTCQSLDFDGITFSGGEPFLQARAAASFLDKLAKPVNVICFTGNTYEDLLQDADAVSFLEHIDVLIDGEYKEQEYVTRGLRGSSNQRFIRLTDRLDSVDFENFPRKLEIHVKKRETFMVGIPERRVLNSLNSIFCSGRE